LAKLNKGDTVVVQGVVVQGTVNGASVTASTIIDQGQPAAAGTTGTTAKHSNFLGGIFGGIGSFFSHLFGF
jgi:cyanophycinase-like exopeptidase